MAATEKKVRIDFYRANIGRENNTSHKIFNPLDFFKKINNLLFIENNGRYWRLGDDVYCCWVEEETPYLKVRFGKIRHSNFPQIETEGKITDIDIDDKSGILEVIHIVFFKDNIIGTNYNHYGPRLKRLEDYFREKLSDEVCFPSFEPILRKDLSEKLNKLRSLDLFTIRINKTYAHRLNDLNSTEKDTFIKDFANLAVSTPGQLTISCNKIDKDSLLKDALKKLFSAFSRDSEIFKKFEISGEFDNEKDKFDFVKELFILKKMVKLQDTSGRKSRILDPEDTYRAIIKAYEESKKDINFNFLPSLEVT